MGQDLERPGVITDFGVYNFLPRTHETVLTEIHPEVTLQQVRDNMGSEVKVSPRLRATPPPTEEELHIIRQELDPDRIHPG